MRFSLKMSVLPPSDYARFTRLRHTDCFFSLPSANNRPRTPTQFGGYTDDELRSMLRAERLAITQRLVTLKHEVRGRVAEIEALEERLTHITSSE